MPRKTTDEERKLWKKVADTATPLAPAASAALVPSAPATKPKPNTPAPMPPIKPFVIGSKARPATAVPTTTQKQAPQMDARAFSKMKRGKLRPEATLDLHGMTVAQAHPELVRFVMNASARGFRLVLIISGKGKSTNHMGYVQNGNGILRTSVPVWLKQAPVAQVILDVAEAHQKHGGGGAFYVYLRKRRG